MWPFKKKNTHKLVEETEKLALEAEINPRSLLTPLEIIEEVRDMLDPYFCLKFPTDYFSVYKTNQDIKRFPDENLIRISTCLPPRKQMKIEKHVLFPSFRFVGKESLRLEGTEVYTWEMKLTEYEKFFDNYHIEYFRNDLKRGLRQSITDISAYPDDAGYVRLLLENAEPLRNILITFDEFISNQGYINKDILDLFKETIGNFLKEVKKRTETLKTSETVSFETFSAAQKEKLLQEIKYQREIHNLNETNPYLLIEPKLKQKTTFE